MSKYLRYQQSPRSPFSHLYWFRDIKSVITKQYARWQAHAGKRRLWLALMSGTGYPVSPAFSVHEVDSKLRACSSRRDREPQQPAPDLECSSDMNCFACWFTARRTAAT